MRLCQIRTSLGARAPATPLLALVVALSAAFGAARPAQAATERTEVVYLVGKGERRESPNAAWVPVAASEKLAPGAIVRTLGDSQMALVMPDRSQVRLNQNSQLEVGSQQQQSGLVVSVLRLVSGRIWSLARPPSVRGETGERIRLTTPTATIGIRGTDWEVEIQPDGSTQLVVLSGVVEMSNPQGAVTVASGEAAVSREGSAPVKFVLVNPSSRVQWVSSWRPQPQRWAGNDAQRLAPIIRRIDAGEYSGAEAALAPAAGSDAGSAVLLADLMLQRGDLDAAQRVLTPHARDGSGDPRAVALLAQVLARQDRIDAAQALVASGLRQNPRNVELQLAEGDLAILQGDAARARASYQAILRDQPDNVDAWYGVGLIASEREQVGAARSALGEALRRSPQNGRVQAELAATETFAGNLPQGRQLLESVLAREPSNYQALTALGINKLKAGQTSEALDDFLRAGAIEPRYSRAWLYSGVALYQLGERKRAIEAFHKAAELDAKDPVPHMYLGMVEIDALDPGAAIAESRAAQERMPYLKSLNQVANNQKGSANVGSSLTAFGLEEWADFYASEAYSPYWGGSHLFRADRYTGKFNKNSELFKGYLTEPTTFGASNRDATLIPSPGHYGRLEALYERTDWQQGALIGTFNGMTATPVPLAYFISGDFAKADARPDDSTGRSRNFTLGLGARPTYQLGLFAFATDTQLRGKLRSTQLPSDNLDQDEKRVDVGLNFKIDPENQLWLKGGKGSQDNSVNGSLFSPEISATLNTAFSTNIFKPLGTLDSFFSTVDQDDVQFRHSFSAIGLQWSWGVERSNQDQNGGLSTTFAPARLDNTQHFTIRATDVWASALYKTAAGHQAQVDVFGQKSEQHRTDVDQLTLAIPGIQPALVPTSGDRDYNEVNPRLGFKWQVAPSQAVRFAWQKWRRPASSSTLSPVDTVGIPVNDRLVSAGGKYERGRVQYDGELGSGFVRAYADHERVDNGLGGRHTAVSDFQVTQLESLRNRPDIFAPKSELEDTPQFQEGRSDSAGISYNRLFSRTHAMAFRYSWHRTEQTGANSGLMIPFIPRHFAQIDSQWSIPGQWLLGASATWRSMRYRDDLNTKPIKAGWSLGGTAYWESLDKHHSVHLVLDNVLSDKAAGNRPDAHFSASYAYRF
ncbi:tetratricopeptide repeat protein [Caenimonas aquaedulcis]|uniref:Tetratricopeptide repeat protein n=1 Tax=Caenimonas aquaedulcis TaxID=2793270 RepID=A0A931ME95_9BURK|nr:tetratricopeptide repeat protein [Caenimonas aquaedulcis]MBG9386553.1 tetratricopeptide repeat protein [Caenimonas aquaedulcis]